MPELLLETASQSAARIAPTELVRDTLSALQTQRSDLVSFVEQLLDEVEQLSLSLEDKERDIATQQKQLRDRELQLKIQQEENQQIQQSAIAQQAQLDSLLTEVGVLRTELSAADQHGDAAADAAFRTQLQSVTEEREALRTQLEESNRRLLETEQQVQQQQEDSLQVVALENELELTRHRIAELTEQLADQKNESQSQQAHWTDELRQMRQLLAQAMKPAGAVADHEEAWADYTPNPMNHLPETSVDPEDQVVDSITEQFSKLQQDVARRRKQG